MSVERRRTIALAGTALLIAGALGFYTAFDRIGGDAAVTAIGAEPSGPSAEAPPPAALAPLDEAERSAQPGPVAAEPEQAVAALDPALAARDLEPAGEPVAAEPAAVAEEPSADETPADAPVFDIVRVEPSGDAVIAGRTRAGATVELLRNGEVHDIVVADASGAFAFVPPPLPPGAHEITLQVRDGDAAPLRSRESVTVVVDAGRAATPIVALAAPDAPTRILSRPDPLPGPAPTAADPPAPVVEIAPDAAPAPLAEDAPPAAVADAAAAPEQTRLAAADAAGPLADRRAIRVATVEAESDGGLYVSGEGEPSASVRLYLNETFVGRASADHVGSISFAIGRGVRPGVYRVRLDDIDPRDGAVLSRAEVEFEMPRALAEAAPALVAPDRARRDVAAAPATAAQARETLAAAQPATAPAASADDGRDATLVIPEVNTALVSRGDSLWRISRRVYGAGLRYTVIFDANQEQIRDPNLIFPGQIFVLPGNPASEETAER